MQLVFATHNQNKVNEIRSLLPEKMELVSLNDIEFFETIEESADTLEGNSLLKANTVKLYTKKNCFADDTGLEVAHLNGAPGVRSARYSGENTNDAENVKKLLYEMRFATNRAAQFRTVITLLIDDDIHVFEGIVKGQIGRAPTGNNGFGYDPVFIPDGYSISFAELTLEEKNKISHRALAFGKMIAFLREFSLR
jgi:XTP/dITP diphosphohydrolase